MNTSVTRTTRVSKRAVLFYAALFLFSISVIPETLQAAPNISARYTQASGTQLVIEINAGSNPPASAILIQRMPSGVSIVDSSPSASNYNPKKNKAKWLLRNLSPGKSKVRMTLDRAVSANEVSAEIRYKPRKGGKMMTIQVKK